MLTYVRLSNYDAVHQKETREESVSVYYWTNNHIDENKINGYVSTKKIMNAFVNPLATIPQ